MRLDRGSIAARGVTLGLAWAVVAAGLAVVPPPAAAQLVAAGTALAAKTALESAIGELKQALSQLTSGLRSLGNLLQANAQDVLADFDRILESNISPTFDWLHATQRRFVEDAPSLAGFLPHAAPVVGSS